MKGSDGVTMDGRTRITWVLRASQEALHTGPQRLIAGVGERRATLRARLIAAVVELAAEGSHPRLCRTRYVPTAA